MKLPFQKYWRLQKRYFSRYKKHFLFLSVCLFGSIGLQLLNPQIIRFYIDTFDLLGEGFISISFANQRLFEAVALYFLIAVLQQCFHVSALYLSQVLSWNSTNDFRVDFARHCMALDMTFHNQHTAGEMVERMEGDVTNLTNFFSQFTILILANLILIIGILAALFLEDWRLGMVFLLFTLSTLSILYVIWNLAVPFRKIARKKAAELLGQIEEHLTGREDLVALGASPYAMKRFHQFSKEEYSSEMKAVIVSRLIQITMFGMIALGETLVFVAAIPLHNEGILTIGTIFMVNSYVIILINPIIQIIRESQNLAVADASIERINEFLIVEPKITKSLIPLRPFERTIIQSKGALSLEFDRVSFQYQQSTEISDEELVLNKLSFGIEPGKTLGLIGRTGSGKTTISRLIFRLYDVNDGVIRVNGIDLRKIPLQELRSKIAYITQDVEVFSSSVRNNITLFDQKIPDSDILHCITAVGLQEWLNRLPEGLDTILGESGFSAGEAQLLAITRVFLQNPSLVILDEPSSRLDPYTERLIDKALDELLNNRTSIIIAHRLKTLDRVDIICHIGKGRLLEIGSREKLVKDPNSLFSQLVTKGDIEEILA